MFNQNFAPRPQIPTPPGTGFNFAQVVSPLNSPAQNGGVLPLTQALPNAVNTQILNPTVSTPGQPVPLELLIPSSALLDGEPFEILVSGALAVASCTMGIYANVSANIASNTLIKSFLLTGNVNNWVPFYVRLTAMGSGPSLYLISNGKALCNATFVADSVGTLLTTGWNPANNPNIRFSLTGQPAAANAANQIRIARFAILS